MFKLLRLFLPLLILVFVLPMIMPGPNGKPVMSPKDWLPDASTVDKITGFFTGSVNKAANLAGQEDLLKNTKKQLYKWQDEKGRWHFSDDPMQAALHATEEKMPEVFNTMAPPPMPEKGSAGASTSNDSGGFKFSPTSIPVQDIPKLIEDTKKVRAQLEERNKDLEKL